MAVDWNTHEEAGYRADDKYMAAVRAAKDDPSLSNLGRAQRIDAAEAVRVAEVAAAQADAIRWGNARRVEIGVKLAEKGAAAAKARRAELGDYASFELARAKVAGARLGDLPRLVQDSPDSWHRTVTLELALALVEQRLNVNERDRAAQEALAALNQLHAAADPEVEALQREAAMLADLDTMVAGLDRRAFAAEIARTYQVRADSVT